MKVCVVGAGKVGSSAAFMILVRGLVDDLSLIDVGSDKARGDAIDLFHSVSEFDGVSSISGGSDIELAAGSDLVVVCAGTHRMPGECRLDLIDKNSSVVADVTGDILGVCDNPIVLIVTNPVDVMTYVAYKKSGLSGLKVFGLGAVVDSIRFKTFIASNTGASLGDIEAFTFGLHGKNTIPAFSQSTINGKPVREVIDEKSLEGIINDVRFSADNLVKYKGGTCYAPAVAITKVVDAIVNDKDMKLPVSTYIDELGVCASRLAKVGRQGATPLDISFSDGEEEEFNLSVSKLKTVCAKTGY